MGASECSREGFLNNSYGCNMLHMLISFACYFYIWTAVVKFLIQGTCNVARHQSDSKVIWGTFLPVLPAITQKPELWQVQCSILSIKFLLYHAESSLKVANLLILLQLHYFLTCQLNERMRKLGNATDAKTNTHIYMRSCEGTLCTEAWNTDVRRGHQFWGKENQSGTRIFTMEV